MSCQQCISFVATQSLCVAWESMRRNCQHAHCISDQWLRLQARVFQNSKDALSGAPLELPAVHFVCGHSFNLRSLGENEKECPICAPQFRSILDIKRAMRTGATEQVSAALQVSTLHLELMLLCPCPTGVEQLLNSVLLRRYC